jgi:hypothetical protein
MKPPIRITGVDANGESFEIGVVSSFTVTHSLRGCLEDGPRGSQ